MEIDKTTLADLSLFSADEDFSVFGKFNFCKTTGGKMRLAEILKTPLSSVKDIEGVQQTLRLIIQKEAAWPLQISNGSVMVVEKFYLSSFDTIPNNASSLSAFTYKIFHSPDFSLIKYSFQHCFDFIKGMHLFTEKFLSGDCPEPLKLKLTRVVQILNKVQFSQIKNVDSVDGIKMPQQLYLAGFLKYHFKQNMFDLLEIFYQLDAWYAMAMAVKKYDFCFPEFTDQADSFINAKGLYHILLPQPVDYDVQLDPSTNFLFLTGANMAGKSTFIKSVGVAVFLAHTGMGVPAKKMELCFFDGLLSNINVVDNIAKGESYFYNEVQRIKATVTKISDGRKWLILIDELFKGTNVQDAMKCSCSVIEGLLKIKRSLFILSTHLYEISEDLKSYPNIQFKYFETSIVNGQLRFGYQLKDGVSNDRLGYLILQKEGVVDILRDL